VRPNSPNHSCRISRWDQHPLVPCCPRNSRRSWQSFVTASRWSASLTGRLSGLRTCMTDRYQHLRYAPRARGSDRLFGPSTSSCFGRRSAASALPTGLSLGIGTPRIRQTDRPFSIGTPRIRQTKRTVGTAPHRISVFVILPVVLPSRRRSKSGTDLAPQASGAGSTDTRTVRYPLQLLQIAGSTPRRTAQTIWCGSRVPLRTALPADRHARPSSVPLVVDPLEVSGSEQKALPQRGGATAFADEYRPQLCRHELPEANKIV